jgi:hypothetical protein
MKIRDPNERVADVYEKRNADQGLVASSWCSAISDCAARLRFVLGFAGGVDRAVTPTTFVVLGFAEVIDRVLEIMRCGSHVRLIETFAGERRLGRVCTLRGCILNTNRSDETDCEGEGDGLPEVHVRLLPVI